jgi:hypothetical protein
MSRTDRRPLQREHVCVVGEIDAHAQRFPRSRLTLLRERLRSRAEALRVTTTGGTAGHERPLARAQVKRLLDLLLLAPDLQDAVRALEATDGAEPDGPAAPPVGGPRGDVGPAAGGVRVRHPASVGSEPHLFFSTLVGSCWQSSARVACSGAQGIPRDRSGADDDRSSA